MKAPWELIRSVQRMGIIVYCKVLDIGDNDRSAGGWTEVP